MVALGVEAHQDVVLVGCPEEQSAKFDLALGKVDLWLEIPKGLLVFRRQDDDGGSGLDLHFGKGSLKHGAHALELVGNAAPLLFTAVGGDYEVWAAYFQP